MQIRYSRNSQVTVWGASGRRCARSLSTLGDVVADAYRWMKQNENSTMAYKGGHYEKDLLASLGIPSANLKEFGCPKAEVLIEQMVWLETCGNHIVSEAGIFSLPEGRSGSVRPMGGKAMNFIKHLSEIETFTEQYNK